MAIERVRGRRTPYAPLSASYYRDEALVEAGEAAELLYVRGLAFCAEHLEQDGFISDRQLRLYVGSGLRNLQQRANRLVRQNLWERVTKESNLHEARTKRARSEHEDYASGYRVRSWLDWNMRAEELAERREMDRQRKARMRADQQKRQDRPRDHAGEDAGSTPEGVRADTSSRPRGVRADSVAQNKKKRQKQEPKPDQPEGEVDPPLLIPPDSSVRADSPEPTNQGKHPARRATRIPASFSVTTEMRQWARTKTPNVDPDWETEKFIDFWNSKPGQQATKLDWNKTWQVWMRSAEERAPRRQRPQAASNNWTPPPPPREIADDPQAYDEYLQAQYERRRRSQ